MMLVGLFAAVPMTVCAETTAPRVRKLKKTRKKD
jgi:hypothetical protein